MGKKLEKLYTRVNALEISRASSDEGINTLTGIFKEFAIDFKDHTNTEMSKYDKYDNDVKIFNVTLSKAVDSIDYLKQSNLDQNEKSNDLGKKFIAHEKTFTIEVAGLKKRQNIAIGIVIGFMAVVSVVGFIINVAAGIVDTTEMKNEELIKKIHYMENMQNRNYGNIEAMKNTNLSKQYK